VRAGSVTYGAAGDSYGVDAAAESNETADLIGIEWTAEARQRIGRIPSFVRPVVVKRIESYARRAGVSGITEDLIDRIREEMPVDFSRRAPFFVRDRR
jgi:hypothetical protein